MYSEKDCAECHKLFGEMKEFIGRTHSNIEVVTAGLSSVVPKLEGYEDTVLTIDGNSTLNVSQIDSHTKCMEIIQQIKFEMIKLGANFTKTESFEGTYYFAKTV